MKTTFFEFHTSLSDGQYYINGVRIFIWELYWRGYDYKEILTGFTDVQILYR